MFKKLREIKPRILIVDDNQNIGEVLSDYLTEKGYEVSYAGNGDDALHYVKRTRPHIVLWDVRMPDISGIEVLKQIIEIDPKVGVVMITAHQEDELGREALMAGAIDFITKPIDFEYLDTSLMLKLSAMLE
ncbi:MAG: response regulator [Candidatus Hatepunaea meridiana]|nr:response regulator [Candidatus Hatepunaea meridiana]